MKIEIDYSTTQLRWIARDAHTADGAEDSGPLASMYGQGATREAALIDLLDKLDDYWRGEMDKESSRLSDTQRANEQAQEAYANAANESERQRSYAELLRSTLQSLEQAYSNKHSPQHRLACLSEARSVLSENQLVNEEVPEGCTPADAAMLRKANHGLADENTALRGALQELVRQIKAFTEEHGEADFYTGDAVKLLAEDVPTESLPACNAEPGLDYTHVMDLMAKHLQSADCPNPMCVDGSIRNTGPDPVDDACPWCYERHDLISLSIYGRGTFSEGSKRQPLTHSTCLSV